ncbi:MAG: hypothetical protein JRJ39_11955 [Deltaproteobacteria bacterium]|nr:hypothetical protein [Deltaproteobacteria bacterium]MBW1847257.1 hypothetical protein [Deltaproteobacteria bacterium]MBW1983700.1 hypothetical protein [Deltaproteobacteria bacterium]
MNIISNTIKYGRKESAWQKKYEATAPKTGELAADFELFDSEGKSKIKLSDFRGKQPVGLVFGSFT